MIRHLALKSALAGVLAATALPALAAGSSLSVDGLDPGKAQDVAAFSAQLDAAVKAACKGKGSGVQLVGNKRMTCKDMAKNSAVAKLPEAWRTALANPPSEAQAWRQADR